MNFGLISIYANEFLIAGVMTLAWEIFQSAMFFCYCMLPSFVKTKADLPLISLSRQESCWSFIYTQTKNKSFFLFLLYRWHRLNIFFCSSPQWSLAAWPGSACFVCVFSFFLFFFLKMQRMLEESRTCR